MVGEPIITVAGSPAGDPELRYVSLGMPAASFTVASTPRTLGCQTQQQEDGEAMFIHCFVWRGRDENVAESFNKGMQVLVTGWLTVRGYKYNGQQCTSLEMQVDEIGPSLRHVRAQVTKVAGGGSGGGNFDGGNSYQGGEGYGDGRVPCDAPQGGPAHDPWSSALQGGSAFDDNPPS